jgi:hypothetical protein
MMYTSWLIKSPRNDLVNLKTVFCRLSDRMTVRTSSNGGRRFEGIGVSFRRTGLSGESLNSYN